MTDIVAFFQNKAHAFSTGDMASVADQHVFPYTVNLGDRSIQLDSATQTADVMREYRDKLSVESYARTDCEILHIDGKPSCGYRVLLHWRNVNTRGAEISAVDASYMCDMSDTGAIRITHVDILSDPTDRLAPEFLR